METTIARVYDALKEFERTTFRKELVIGQTVDGATYVNDANFHYVSATAKYLFVGSRLYAELRRDPQIAYYMRGTGTLYGMRVVRVSDDDPDMLVIA